MPGTGSQIIDIRTLRLVLSLLVLAILVGCASIPSDTEPLPEQHALPPAPTGALAEFELSLAGAKPDTQSGFMLLDLNADALNWRLALIDEAVSSLDLMYYLWYGDASGRLLLKRTIEAANRGVRVRLMVDDLLMLGLDRTLVALEAHPNIDLRLFNPWRNRYVGRGLEFLARMGRLNSRMHDKLLIADNRAAILGGRNIGDYYFGLSSSYNFHDLDVLGVGPVARQASEMFDDFWNSSWTVSAAELPATADDAYVARSSRQLMEKLQATQSLAAFPLEPRSWSRELEHLRRTLHFGDSRFIYDRIEAGELVEGVTDPLGKVLNAAAFEALVVNAYIIPEQDFVDAIRRLVDRGVHIEILTNSLESHDVPAVNSHYQKWRKPIIEAGAGLHEMRADPAIKPRVDTHPVISKFSGLHTKAFVVDRRKVFIGSMNFDPRSVNINTEMGVLIDSPALGQAMGALALRDMRPENAWRVTLNDQGNLVWTNSDETVTRQPARNFWQRIADGFFKLLPKSQF